MMDVPQSVHGCNRLAAALQEAVDKRQVAYAVAGFACADGRLWMGAAGDSAANRPASTATQFRIVSMSKAIGCTAALILADRGRLEWDTPVDEVLPQFAELRVMETDGHRVRTRRPQRRATLRHLATHTSGLAYEFWDEDVGRILEQEGIPSIVSGLRAGLAYPLSFEPGTRWRYGGGVDWLGLAVAAIDGRTIDRFCIEEIFEPLHMRDTVFELSSMQRQRLGSVHARGADGSLAPGQLTLDPPARPEFYGMGHALYSTVPDFLRFLQMWLGRGQLGGVRLLSEATVADALENHIGDLRVTPRPSAFPAAVEALDPLPGVDLTHSLIAARTQQPVALGRAAGSAFWAGVLNTHFWLDPAQGRAGVFMTQCTPFLDGGVMEAYRTFEQAVYAW